MVRPMIHKVVRHALWRAFMLALIVAGVLSVSIPPRAFLQPGPLIYDAGSNTFLYTRHALSIADIFEDCEDPGNFLRCRQIDDTWPLVWTDSQANARVEVPGDGVMECNRPPSGQSAFLHIQWEPFEIVRYPADELARCMESGEPVALTIRRKVWLLGFFPLQRPLTSRYVFPGISIVDGRGETRSGEQPGGVW